MHFLFVSKCSTSRVYCLLPRAKQCTNKNKRHGEAPSASGTNFHAVENHQSLSEQTFRSWRTTKAYRSKFSCRGEPPKAVGTNFYAVVDYQSLPEQTFMPWWITKACRSIFSECGSLPMLILLKNQNLAHLYAKEHKHLFYIISNYCCKLNHQQNVEAPKNKTKILFKRAINNPKQKLL